MSASGADRRAKRSKLERLEQILNSVPQVIWSAGPDGSPDFVSEQWRNAYGGEPSELIGDGWIHRVHPDDVEPVTKGWAEALQRPEPYEAQFRLRVPDGQYRWALVTAKPEIGPDGSIRR